MRSRGVMLDGGWTNDKTRFFQIMQLEKRHSTPSGERARLACRIRRPAENTARRIAKCRPPLNRSRRFRTSSFPLPSQASRRPSEASAGPPGFFGCLFGQCQKGVRMFLCERKLYFERMAQSLTYFAYDHKISVILMKWESSITRAVK